MTEQLQTIIDRVTAGPQHRSGRHHRPARMVWGKPELVDADMRMLIEINRHIKIPSPDFTDFFAEAIVHFTLRQTEPKYFLKDHLAEWLEERLIHRWSVWAAIPSWKRWCALLEQAENAPDRFKRWTLAEIERSILTGQGPTRLGGNISPGVVDTDDAKYLRRTLFARAGFGALGSDGGRGGNAVPHQGHHQGFAQRTRMGCCCSCKPPPISFRRMSAGRC
jgi:hypothetical protein